MDSILLPRIISAVALSVIGDGSKGLAVKVTVESGISVEASPMKVTLKMP